MTQSTPLAARFLIAMPGMEDHRFAKSVIYLCAHSEDGAMGLVINRPLEELTFAGLLKHLDIPVTDLTPSVPVHFGGPVERGRGFILHDTSYRPAKGTMTITPTVSLSATLDAITDIAAGRGPERLIFGLGYAGWGPGQLDAELAQNVWLTAEGDDNLLFSGDAASKWQRAMDHAGIDPRLLSSHHGHA